MPIFHNFAESAIGIHRPELVSKGAVNFISRNFEIRNLASRITSWGWVGAIRRLFGEFSLYLLRNIPRVIMRGQYTQRRGII